MMLDRLYLDASQIEAMATGIREVVALPDPIGEVLETNQLENGLLSQRNVWLWELSVYL